MKSGGFSILAVEDEPFSCEILRNILFNYKYTIAMSGESAIEKFKENLPDIVFLDIGLPDISGLDVLKKIKEINIYTTVIMLSSHNERKVVTEAMQNGADGYITKPVSKSTVDGYIKRFVK